MLLIFLEPFFWVRILSLTIFITKFSKMPTQTPVKKKEYPKWDGNSPDGQHLHRILEDGIADGLTPAEIQLTYPTKFAKYNPKNFAQNVQHLRTKLMDKQAKKMSGK